MNVESCYVLLCLLGYKIFTQLDAYCLTYYCPNSTLAITPTEEIPNLDSPLEVTVTLLHVLTHNGVTVQSLYSKRYK